MLYKGSKKVPFKFVCKKCDYSTNRKSQYNRHLQTKKHNAINAKSNANIKGSYTCECGKSYKQQPSLSRHKKTCHITLEITQPLDLNKTTSPKNIEQMFMDLMEKNQELQEQILELSKEPKTIIQTQQNNTFNLNNFLNVQCKDALNLSEFLQQIQLTLDDLIYLGNNGFVKSFQNTFVKQLKNLDQTKRPIHCTDHKRKAMVVKDNNIWKKDEDHELLCQAVSTINKKQISTFSEHSRKKRGNIYG